MGVTLAPPAEHQGVLETAGTSPTRHNLPDRSTAFVGRGPELAEITGLLTPNECRLLNLTGPSGIGKTGLVQQVA